MKYRLLSTLFCYLLPALALAQYAGRGLSPQKSVTQFVVDVWQKDKGLPQNSVSAILQTQDEYLWVATQNGLGRFDGLHFTLFNIQNQAALLSNSISSLCQTQNGDLWAGTNGGGITRIREGRFKSFDYSAKLASNSVLCLLEDPKKANNIWVGTVYGLSYLDANSLTFKTFQVDKTINGLQIHALLSDRKDCVWVGTDKGLFFIKDGKIEPASHIKLPYNSVTSLFQSQDQRIWIGTEEGLVIFDPKTETQKVLTQKDGLTDLFITQIYQDSPQTIWIGTQSGGLHRLVNGKIQTLHAHNGLTGNSIQAIFEDLEGSLWVGLERGGLNRLRDGKFTNYTESEGLADNFTNCIFQDSKGGLWIGTQNAGVSYLKDGKFTNYNTDNGLIHKHIRSIVEDQDGYIWMGSYGGGVSRFKNGKFENFTTDEGLASNVIKAIYPSKKGGVWLATEEGVSYFQHGTFRNYAENIGLIYNSILSVYEAQNGNLWIGTDGGGIHILRPDESYYTYSTQDGLADNIVFGFLEDEKRQIWVITRSGLTRIKDDGELFSFHAEHGHLGDAIHQVILDKDQRFWMSSNDGVFFVKKQDLDDYIATPDSLRELPPIVTYDEADGMLSSDCASASYPAGTVDTSGKLWFPTMRGISCIDPNHLYTNQKIPKVIIHEVMIDGEKWTNFPAKGAVQELAPGKTRFEFHFDALTFIAPDKVRYSYKLEGFDEEWHEEVALHKAFYTNLAPKTYTFRVKASNSDGHWNQEGASLTFRLRPHIYQTIYFKVFIGIFLFALLFFLYRKKLDMMSVRQQNLEELIAERTKEIMDNAKEISEQHDELVSFETIVETINREVEPANVLRVLIAEGLHFFGADKGFFLLFDRESYRFVTLSSHGYKTEIKNFQEVGFQQVMSYCANAEEVANDFFVAHHLHQKEHPLVEICSQHSLILTLLEDELPKVLLIFDYDDEKHFSDKEIARMQRFKGLVESAYKKARMMQLVENKRADLQKTVQKVTDSIQYAQRIQNAILTEPQEVIRHFEDAFIFYRPKDVVSGDFYWFKKIKNHLILAAIDCTGHGVPGAFMTVMANSALHQVIEQQEILDPAEILHEVDKEIADSFRAQNGHKRSDGMDMAILSIDIQSQTLRFAGAKNPLFYVRNDAIHQIKGSKFPIGNNDRYQVKVFKTHEISIQKDDIFYIFSDGFQDQFEGGNGRKFLTSRFRSFLHEYSYLTLHEQANLLDEAFRLWKGDGRQTDDILVMGVKF